MAEKDITLFDFQFSDGKLLTLHQSDQTFVRALQDSIWYNISEDITVYTLVTSDDFDDYYI